MDYSELSFKELRSMLLNGELDHEYMSEEDYSFLLNYETESEDPNVTVIDFCCAGLLRFEKYQDCNNIRVDTKSIFKQVKNENKQRKTRFSFFGIPRRIDIMIIIIIILSIATVTVIGISNIFTDLGFKMFNYPEKTPIDYNGNSGIWTFDYRVYDSMDEMIEAENLNIMYPQKLPDGYEFTVFQFSDFGTSFQVTASSSEPYLAFDVEINTSQIAPDNYLHEINGIKYNIHEMGDNLYLAYWFNDGDYYSIVSSDKAILSEIIENLTGG